MYNNRSQQKKKKYEMARVMFIYYTSFGSLTGKREITVAHPDLARL